MESRNLRTVLFAIVFGLFLLSEADAKTELPELLGKWQFDEMIYRGERQPRLNPNLIMTFDFSETGLSELNYHRLDEEGSCHRLALWYYDSRNKMLYQRVTWLNPKNRPDCGQDPDMQLSQETWSPAKVVNGELHLNVPLSDEEITLVWKRLPEGRKN